MLERHEYIFNGMASRIGRERQNDLQSGFRALAEELFVGNEVSWSKIVALYAFGARLGQHYSDDSLAVLDVADNLAMVAVEKTTPFLRRHGGWVTNDDELEAHLVVDDHS